MGLFGVGELADEVTVGPEGQTGALDALTGVNLNGTPTTPEDVTLTVLNPASNPGVTIDPYTGLVSIAPGTPPGTYTIECLICAKLAAGQANTTGFMQTLSASLFGNANGGSVMATTVGDVDLTADLPCAKVKLTVNVTPPPGALVAEDDAFSISMGKPVSQTVTGNDSYPAGSVFRQTSTPVHGTVTFNPDGSFVYTPNPGFTGVDSFNYEVCIGTVCDPAKVTITVSGSVAPPPNPIPTLGEWGRIIMIFMMLIGMGYASRKVQRR